MSGDEMQQRMREAREQQGFGGNQPGVPGPAAYNATRGGNTGGGPAGGPAGPGGDPGGGFGGPRSRGPGGGGPVMIMGRGRGRFDINRPHGMAYYSVGNSALNAAPYSLTGQPTTKPEYLQQKFGISLGGPLNIPKIYKGGSKTFFFFNYNGSRSKNPYDAFSTVPTQAERSGDFSQLGTQLTDPFSNQPIPNNNFQDSTDPNLKISPAARGLLKFISLPNLPGTAQNFHFVSSTTSNSDDLNIRLMHALGGGSIGPRRRGPQNNLTLGFHYHGMDNVLTNPFPTLGGNTSIRNFDLPVGYIRSFGKLTNIFRVDFNHSRTFTQNLYAFSQNVVGPLGITGVSQDPFDWGVPNLSFTNFASLQDTNPVRQRNQTLTFADNMIWSHGKHTLRWGGDFRRIQLNTQTDNNARGTFVFTGINTGYDFADFLLGLPQQTSAQFGENNYHFRGNSWDLYGQDEWRIRGNLTLNLGLRYEYISPFTELNNRIANLVLSPGALSLGAGIPTATRVLAGQDGFPLMLVRPDRNNFAPRIGIAWKLFSKTVVRAGYGINYNTSAYQTIAQQLAFQPPFSFAETNNQITAGRLTLQDGFPISTTNLITNNYAVDPNYRLGYVQIWNLDIQREIKPTLALNLDYTGTKGTRLDVVEDPNRCPNLSALGCNPDGTRIAGMQPFNWQTSQADSVAHAATVRLRKRLQHGVSIGGTYTFSKSIDDASSIGGGANVIAQNAFDLAAERSLSYFDQRHRFTADYLIELPFGHERRWLSGSGPLRAIFGDWQWSGDWTIASGFPFTPRVLGNFADVSRGSNGTLRADVTGAPLSLANSSVKEWFNTAAFVAPPTGQFGNAARNSIEGPGARLFDMAFTKIFPLRESRMLEFRAQLSNIFNTPQFTTIDTTVTSPTYGQVIAVGAMRSVQLTARFRF